MEIPIGYKFNPKDDEVITLLLHKITGEGFEYSTNFIADAEVFRESPPWQLFEDYRDFSSVADDGIYFFSKAYKKGKDRIKNTKRTIPKYGSWRCETKPKKIVDPKNEGKTLGFRREFSFKGEGGDKWLLTEYCLPEESEKIYKDTTKFKFVICKLRLKNKKTSQEAAVNVVQQENIQTSDMQTDHNEQETIQSAMPSDHNDQEDIQSAMQTDPNFTVEGFDGSISYGGAFTTQESTTNIDYGVEVGSSHLYSNAVLPQVSSDFIIQPQTAESESHNGTYTDLMKSSCNSVFNYNSDEDEDWISSLLAFDD